MKKNRQEEIRQKGFRMADGRRSYYSGPIPLNNASIKIGKQTLQDAILDLGYLKKVNGKLGNKHLVLKALWEKDLDTLREIGFKDEELVELGFKHLLNDEEEEE